MACLLTSEKLTSKNAVFLPVHAQLVHAAVSFHWYDVLLQSLQRGHPVEGTGIPTSLT